MSAHGSSAESFRARCESRAVLVRQGKLTFQDAIDGLQNTAVAYGLDAEIGQDAVQTIMSAVFRSVLR